MKKLLVFLALLSCIIPAYTEQAPQQTAANGRYVYIQHPTFRGEQYLLDTKTGKIWGLCEDKTGGFLFFQAIRFNNADGSIKFMPQ